MKLDDLLDELRNNILNDRGSSTGDDDKLWSNKTLIRYINEAQRRFAKRSYCIWDAVTAEVVDVTLVAGQVEYDIHPSIISVVSAKLEGSQTDLARIGHVLLGEYRTENTNTQFNASLIGTAVGAPLAYATDERLAEDDDGNLAAMSIKVYPTPRTQEAGQKIKLRTVRMPLDELTTGAMSAVPEIPADHHLEMLDWAAYLALRIVDQDAGNRKLAEAFAASFETHVQDARRLVLRKLRAPRPWGFGRGGFSGYER
jgi:hypothetical protein